MDDIRVLDAPALKALAHPLRVSLLELLRRDGPATASSLARRLDETSGATSYHLRQLHRAGLVDEDAERGNNRERWWRAEQRGLQLRTSELPDDPATRAASDLFVREVSRRRAQWVDQWSAEADEWPQRWRDASMDSDWTTRMTPDQLEAMRDEVFDVVQRHAAAAEEEDAPDAERVVAIFHAFPQHAPNAEKDGR